MAGIFVGFLEEVKVNFWCFAQGSPLGVMDVASDADAFMAFSIVVPGECK